MSNIHGFHTLNSSSSNSRPVASSSSAASRQGGASGSGGWGGGGGGGFMMMQDAGDVSPEGGLSMMMGPPRADGQPQTCGARLFPRASWKTLTAVLTIVQLIIFISELIVGSSKFDGAFVSGNDMGGPSGQTMYYMGAKFGPAIRYQNAVWRLITPIFLHAGILHILSNFFFQLRFGFTLEARWGMSRYAIVYLVTGIGASLWSCVCSFRTISVGASGALFGLAGADCVYLAYNWKHIPHNRQEACMLTMVIVITLLVGIGGTNVDNYAHIGGGITGALFALCILPSLSVRPQEVWYRVGAWILFIGHMVLFISLLWGRDY